ncbi:MAG: enoyl-ACP reductase, partial [Planctomycetales bacterium]|nr:enoyl-ACP reductase [Planctomycetales bacterium]
MDFLGIGGKTYLVTGVANKKSVAFHIGKLLEDAGATVVYSVRSEQRREKLGEWLPGREIVVCDVEWTAQNQMIGEQ